MNTALFSADDWGRVGDLFDRLSALPAEERNLQALDEPAAIIEILSRMLAAHDSDDPQLLDRTIHALTGHLLGDDAASNATLDHTGRRFGPWQALEEIGRGGMAVVLRGERADGQFEKEVALKLLPRAGSDSERDRLREEMRILARLEHASIARLIDGGIDDNGTPYLVMEYVRGMPITEYCESHKLDLRSRIQLFQQVTEAVRFAHQHLIVHCDIKPDNVLVSEQGQVKLVDFGIAGLITTGTRARAVSRGLLCSPGYCAPEQMKGAPPATSQDIYNLGAVLYELLCGQRIRPNQTATRLLFGIHPVTEHVPPPSNHHPPLDRDLDAICTKALEQEPDRRFRTAEDLSADIRRWLDHRPVHARSGGIVYRICKGLRRNPLATGLATAAILAVAVGAGVHVGNQMELNRKAAELQTVVQFQSDMLQAIEPHQVGNDLREHLLSEVNGDDPNTIDEIGARIENVNFTDLALTAIDHALLRRSLEEAENRFVDQPLVQAALFQTLASTYRDLGRLEQARTLQERALALRREHLGPGHPQSLASLREKLVLLRRTARADRAGPDSREMVRLHEKHLGGGHIDTANARVAHAQWLMDHDDPVAAEKLFRQGLERLEEGDAQPEDRAAARANLAKSISNQQQFERAEPVYRQAVAETAEVFGPDHPYTLTAQNNLAFTLRNLGNLEEAEAMYIDVHERRLQTLGRNHYAPWIALNNAAAIPRMRGDFVRAEPLSRQAYNGLLESLGSDHPVTLIAQMNLGTVAELNGQRDEAERLLAAGVSAWEALDLSPHPAAARALYRLALIRLDQHDVESGEKLLNKAWRQAEGANHPDTQKTVVQALVHHYEMTAPDEALANEWRDRLSAFQRGSTGMPE